MKELSLFLLFHESEADGSNNSQTVGKKTHKLYGKVILSSSVPQNNKAQEFSKIIYDISMKMLIQKMSLKDIGNQITNQAKLFFSEDGVYVDSISLRHETMKKGETSPKTDYYYEWNNDQNYKEK